MLKRLFSIEDFFDFGARYGIDYRFPQLSSSRERGKEKRIVVQGDVEEMTLSSGLSLTNSNVRVLQPYESMSLHRCPLYTLVVLEGSVALRLDGKEFIVRSGMAFSSRLGDRLTMNVRHPADHHLRTLSLGVQPSGYAQPLLSPLLDEWERGGYPAFLWQLPEHLLAGLRYSLEAPPGLPRQFMLEGAMQQLLGHGLSLGRSGGREMRRPPPPGEQHRLEKVRRLLAQQPEKEYTLDELAHLAAMSASSLRAKFRQLYGRSVFDYLRDCRLELARRYLAQGYSVQQAAWMSGYQHATNFSTAFRRRYGIAPSDARHVC
ncbi:helix-turn-helix transcriptional regulator [Brenneria populi subsp. brevivirga]|uniref:helix-turn-helix transcriptional regulator n=1 Tax=Brenneria populi TaxID=1505588 RepID=UPI002E18244A|nr:helix-turn-helix transcriptional regulator [Brenneria populi subsp. brevivirga]